MIIDINGLDAYKGKLKIQESKSGKLKILLMTNLGLPEFGNSIFIFVEDDCLVSPPPFPALPNEPLVDLRAPPTLKTSATNKRREF